MINWRAYSHLMRFHRPVGIFLLLWPTLWALWLANRGMPSWRLLVIFILGVILTRAAGCIANDYADRDFDGHVERTKMRPLATGALSSRQALIALSVLGLLALGLVCLLNPLSIALSVIAAGLALLYPWLKRVTHFPQVALGLAFAMSVPMSFAASINALPPLCWLLFAIAVVWPLVYDTAYAINDQVDDAKLGLKSTALWFGSKSPVFIGALQSVLIGLWIWLGFITHLNAYFWCALTIHALGFLYQQYLLTKNQAFDAFLSNQWLGAILWLGIALSLS